MKPAAWAASSLLNQTSAIGPAVARRLRDVILHRPLVALDREAFRRLVPHVDPLAGVLRPVRCGRLSGRGVDGNGRIVVSGDLLGRRLRRRPARPRQPSASGRARRRPARRNRCGILDGVATLGGLVRHGLAIGFEVLLVGRRATLGVVARFGRHGVRSGLRRGRRCGGGAGGAYGAVGRAACQSASLLPRNFRAITTAIPPSTATNASRFSQRPFFFCSGRPARPWPRPGWPLRASSPRRRWARRRRHRRRRLRSGLR